MTIQPDMEKHVKYLNPATGIANGESTPYFGIWIPCRVTDRKGNEAYREKLFLITGSRERILANDSVLTERGWVLAYKPIRFSNRWSLEYVKRFLEGNDNPDPNALLAKLIDALRTYVEFPSHQEAIYYALWVVGTYFHHIFQTYPYLYVGGVKRAGKTKVLTLLYCLAFNAVFSNNMSTACIYRLIRNARCTLLIDETEKLSNPERAQEFRAILLAGYKVGQKVYRVEKTRREELVPEAFEIYSPKALANISGIEDVLEDRCKTVFMRRSLNRNIVDREINQEDPIWGELRDELHRFYLGLWREVKREYDHLGELCESGELVNVVRSKGVDTSYLTGREVELWKPILALACFFDSTKFTCSLCSPCSHRSVFWCMTELAIEHARFRQVENMTETGALILLQTLVANIKSDDFYLVKDLRSWVSSQFDEEQKWLTTKWIGNTLRGLGFKEKRRVGTGYEYRLTVQEVSELAKRMQVELPEERKTQTSLDTLADKVQFSRAWLTDPKNLDEEGFADRLSLTDQVGPEAIQALEKEGALQSHPTKVNRIHLVRHGGS